MWTIEGDPSTMLKWTMATMGVAGFVILLVTVGPPF